MLIRRSMMLSVLLLLGAAHAQVAQGDWQGTLQGPNLPIVFHLGGAGSGTADSPSQSANGMPLSYSVNGNAITITIPSVSATYRATVNGSQMSGTFSQNGQNLPLTMSKSGGSAPAPSPQPGGLQGDWQGTLQGPNLPIVFHLGGAGSGTADSPSQSANGMPLSYSVNGNAITITIPSVSATYRATVNGSQMSGTFSQNGQNLPLTMNKN